MLITENNLIIHLWRPLYNFEELFKSTSYIVLNYICFFLICSCIPETIGFGQIKLFDSFSYFIFLILFIYLFIKFLVQI